jgi:hypothetical protein
MRHRRPCRIFALIIMLCSMMAVQVAYAACYCPEMFNTSPIQPDHLALQVENDSAMHCHEESQDTEQDNCADTLQIEKANKISDWTPVPELTAARLIYIVSPPSHLTAPNAYPSSTALLAPPGSPPLRVHHCSYQL